MNSYIVRITGRDRISIQASDERFAILKAWHCYFPHSSIHVRHVAGNMFRVQATDFATNCTLGNESLRVTVRPL